MVLERARAYQKHRVNNRVEAGPKAGSLDFPLFQKVIEVSHLLLITP